MNVYIKEVAMKELTEPLTREERKKQTLENKCVVGIIAAFLVDFMDYNYEQILDIISRKLIENDCLMDISYEVVGLKEDGCLLLSVRGIDPNADEFIEEEKEVLEKLKNGEYDFDVTFGNVGSINVKADTELEAETKANSVLLKNPDSIFWTGAEITSIENLQKSYEDLE